MENSPAAVAPALSDYYQFSRPEVTACVVARGKRVLDVGCAAGAMGAAMLAEGAEEVVGIEYNPPAARLARTRLSGVFCTDASALLSLPYPPGYFDCITFADVLEHLPNPMETLRHLKPYLAATGTIVCSIPNVRHESALMPLLVLGRWDYVDAGILDRTHLRFFTADTAVKLLADAGFAISAPVQHVKTRPSADISKASAFVASMGGDPRRFEAEATTLQFLLTAAPADPAAHGPRAAALANPWSGSRGIRLLMAPDLTQPAESWQPVLRALLAGPGADASVTVGLALPADAVAATMPAVTAVTAAMPDDSKADLLILEAPADSAGWERLLAACTSVVGTGGAPTSASAATSMWAPLARRVGTEVKDVRAV